MKRPLIVALIVAILFGAEELHSCSLVEGYFYQLSRLRGVVVGIQPGWWGWLRGRIPAANATMRLYTYCSPCRITDRELVKVVATNAKGQFDFGSLQNGHYILVIDWPTNAGTFDVEIKSSPTPTELVMIDVSPIKPDCKGGHTFKVVSAQAK